MPGCRVVLNFSLMKPAAAKEKRRSSGPTRSYRQTRIRGSRLLNAARLLSLIELSRRLQQAYEHVYDQQAADWLLPQNPVPTSPPARTPFENKLNECTQRLFGVELRSFTASTRGQLGSFSGYGADALSGGGKDMEITVANDAKNFSGVRLGQLYTRFTGQASGSLMGITFPSGTSPSGINYADAGFTPYRNFTGNNLRNPQAILATQIHELGNSLQYITGVTMAANSRAGIQGDTDPGTRLERCVFGGEYDQRGRLHRF